MAGLNDEQLTRYARHIVLREIGGGGQARLLDAHVVVIGAGGIGSPAIQYLAAAGIGRLTIIDDDRVDLSNLQRQTIFSLRDLDASKAEAAECAVRRIDPDLSVESVVERIDSRNAARLIEGADVILDGCDNFATRLVVADAALAAHIPLVSAAVTQFEGQLATYRGWEVDRPCYRCVVGNDPERPGTSCSEVGVMGAMAGIMGSMAALETIRAIVPFGEDMAGRLLIADAISIRFRTLTVPKDPACPACGTP